MTQALLICGTEQKTVTVEETADGGLVVWMNDEELFKLQPVAEPTALSSVAAPNRLPQMSDLNGDPAHDWPLFVRRFQKTQMYILVGIASYYKEHFAYSVPSIENLLRADEDLEAVWSILSGIITTDGQLKRGHRKAIADQLGVKDAGNYRGRIDAVISLILSNSNDLLESSSQKAEFPNKSNEFQEPRKTAKK